MTEPMVKIENVSKSFGAKRFFAPPPVFAVRSVTLEIPARSTLGIVGESGSGKSTLLRIALGLTRPDAGRVLIAGQDVTTLRGGDLKAMRRRVQPIFQNPASSFNPRQTIRQILMTPLQVHRPIPQAGWPDRIAKMLELVGLDDAMADRMPHQLSGGQKQRVAIARAIILDPQVVMADEPTSALDVSVQAQVLDLFSRIQSEMGLTTLFVSHNLAVIRQVSDCVAVMQHGQLVEYGPTDQIFDDPQQDYTRKLIASVPDPRRAFRKKEMTL